MKSAEDCSSGTRLVTDGKMVQIPLGVGIFLTVCRPAEDEPSGRPWFVEYERTPAEPHAQVVVHRVGFADE